MDLMSGARSDGGAGGRGGKVRSPWPKPTRSSLLAALRRGDQKAMPALCEAYWTPLHQFICARGCKPDDAHDVTQAFFVKMMKPGFFAAYDRDQGKGFGAWLRTVAKYFYFNWARKSGRNVVGVTPSFVEERLERDCDGTSETDRAFDHALTEISTQRALERLRRRYADEGQEQLFELLLRAVLGERRKANDAAVSKLVGKSVAVLKKDRHKEKQTWVLRYKGCLRDELAAFGVARASMDRAVAELFDASCR
jgi:DNA-directed RNA polymerase specialized sigma24 family protein